MKTIRMAWLLALMVLVASGQDTASAPITEGQRVFTCGNSFHWYTPPIISDMAAKAGIANHVVVGLSKIGGSQAIQHWNIPDDKNQAKAALTTGMVDVLTLACMLHPDPGIDHFAKLAYEHNPNVRVILQEFWIPWDTFEWPFKGDQKSVDPNIATVASLQQLHEPYFKELEAYVEALNAKLGKRVVLVAPIGKAVLALRSKVIAGQAPGIDKQSDLFSDKLGHPQPPIQALAAYCNFAIMYQRNPIGLPAPDLLANSRKPHWADQLNRMLQEIAWEVVSQSPLSGIDGKP